MQRSKTMTPVRNDKLLSHVLAFLNACFIFIVLRCQKSISYVCVIYWMNWLEEKGEAVIHFLLFRAK